MKIDSHSHLIEIDESRKKLIIYRVVGDKNQFYTSVNLPETKWTDNQETIEDFCKTLGENILLDSPQARRILGIDN